jgi:hypothetical protein
VPVGQRAAGVMASLRPGRVRASELVRTRLARHGPFDAEDSTTEMMANGEGCRQPARSDRGWLNTCEKRQVRDALDVTIQVEVGGKTLRVIGLRPNDKRAASLTQYFGTIGGDEYAFLDADAAPRRIVKAGFGGGEHPGREDDVLFLRRNPRPFVDGEAHAVSEDVFRLQAPRADRLDRGIRGVPRHDARFQQRDARFHARHNRCVRPP